MSFLRIERGYFCFRIRGYGLMVADRRRYLKTFSYRTGAVKVRRLGRWGFRALRPG